MENEFVEFLNSALCCLEFVIKGKQLVYHLKSIIIMKFMKLLLFLIVCLFCYENREAKKFFHIIKNWGIESSLLNSLMYLVSNNITSVISKSNKQEKCIQKITCPLTNERYMLVGSYFYTFLVY